MQIVKSQQSTHNVYEFIEDGEVVFTVHQFTDMNDKSLVIDTVVMNKHDGYVTDTVLREFLVDLIDDHNKEEK